MVHRGLLREAEAKALRTLATGQGGFDPEPKKADILEKLARRLSAHRTAALQIELARNPQAAQAALVHGMVQRVLHSGYAEALPIGINSRPQDGLETHAPDHPHSPAAAALQALHTAWRDEAAGGWR